MYRPSIDDATSRVFGRPEDLDGSFAPVDRREDAAPGVSVRPPDPVLAQAFGRPDGSTELLQRDPDSHGPEPEPEPVDPWRSPEAIAKLGDPAVPMPVERVLLPAEQLSAREVLFGSRVAPKALAVLGAIALVIGLAGGVVGRLIGDTTADLNSKKVELVQSSESSRPRGQIAKVADAVLPSVVSIQTSVGDQGATGSGVVFDSAGYVVTNNHVISMAATDTSGRAKIQVNLSDGTKVPARVVGRDIRTDLAVLKIEVKKLVAAQLGKSDAVQVGEDVIAVGSPLGLNKTVTSGIVSAMHRAVPLNGEGSDTDAVIDAVQTDASINPGNSGGPLIDFDGRVIGINSAIRSQSGGSVGLGFAIPIDTVVKVAQTLIRDGRMHHSDLGMTARKAAVTNDVRSGAEVANVVGGGPAAKAGIVEKDVIVKVGDREVTDSYELTVAVQSLPIGQTVTVQLIRDGRQVDVPVTLGSD